VHSPWVCDNGDYNSTADEDSSVLGSYAMSTVTSLTFWRSVVPRKRWQLFVADIATLQKA